MIYKVLHEVAPAYLCNLTQYSTPYSLRGKRRPVVIYPGASKAAAHPHNIALI